MSNNFEDKYWICSKCHFWSATDLIGTKITECPFCSSNINKVVSNTFAENEFFSYLYENKKHFVFPPNEGRSKHDLYNYCWTDIISINAFLKYNEDLYYVYTISMNIPNRIYILEGINRSSKYYNHFIVSTIQLDIYQEVNYF